MELNILLRGQSNAFLMGEYNGGAQAMATKVETLLGFDGVTDKVSLEYSSRSETANTVFSGTSFLKDWLNAKDGDWQNGWTVDELEQSLLTFVGNLSAAQKAEPTAVVWLHSEYDSGNSGLTPAEFESAVRFDAALVRQAFGQPAAACPICSSAPSPIPRAATRATRRSASPWRSWPPTPPSMPASPPAPSTPT